MKKKREYLVIGLLVVVTLLLAACGPGGVTEEPTSEPQETIEQATAEPVEEETEEEEEPLKFAVITSGPRDDNSWNEAAWNGVQALEERGIETAFSERIAEGDELRILREYVDQGFDIIVAHGFGYQDGVFEVAGENPDVNFAWAGGINRTAENVADYDQPFYQGAYVAGVVAGHMTESNVLGSLSGFDIPVCHSMGEAFLAGARSVNPEVSLIRTAAGSWEDVAASKEAALAQAEAGVDYWIECGEGPALGAIEAAKEVGGYTTGYVGDMSENGPETIVASIVWNLEPLFNKMVEQTRNGTFANTYYSMGVADGSGSLVIEYNEGLADEIPDEAREAADAALEGIIAGEIEVPYLPEGELGEGETGGEAEAVDLSEASLALITSGPRDDNSWNEAAWNAVQALEEQGVETAFSERIAEGDELRILREYVDQGFEMIVAHGFGYQDGVFEVAAENPDVNFAWAGGIDRTAENVADYDQPFYQGAYVAGVVAGHMTESNVLGSLSGFDIPVCHSMGEAFLAGARSVNPEVSLIRTAAGSWEDVAASKEAALAQAEAGVDFWIECGEGPALGAIEAAKEVGGYTTGYVGDMSENGPETIVVSIVWNLEPLFTKMLEQTLDGTFDNPYYSMGVADGSGSLVIAYNEGLADEIPDEAREAADAALEGIIAGEIEVPYLPEGELGE